VDLCVVAARHGVAGIGGALVAVVAVEVGWVDTVEHGVAALEARANVRVAAHAVVGSLHHGVADLVARADRTRDPVVQARAAWCRGSSPSLRSWGSLWGSVL
jgi:hypothetical protein